ncbi:unnamed protein product [Mytilus coruscus]|uniref:Uncharacterized protein n=1 Tax=Mytilus coruscus TaxID=42192 RepID=A0A6J8ED83_MYTCO|nr:unnamed protein product [Mytilus coruscus]
MGEDIQSHVNTCSVCNRFKALNRKPKASLQSYPLDRVAIDVIGPLPHTLVDVLSPVLYKIKNRYKSETVHHDKLKKYQSDDVPAWAVAVQKGIKMSEIYNCNWADCLYEGKKRDTIWHIIFNHVQEVQVPFYCNICHYRGNTRRTMERHIITYKPHLEKMEEFNIDSCNSCIIKSVNPYFIKLGTDASCDAIYKDQSCIVTQEVEEIIEIMEDSGLNRFGSYIARLEQRLKAKEDDVQSAERKLRKGEEGSKKQLQEKDDIIRQLERKLRHKDNEVEVLRRKLRIQEYETDDEKENEMPRKKLKGYVVKKTVYDIMLIFIFIEMSYTCICCRRNWFP